MQQNKAHSDSDSDSIQIKSSQVKSALLSILPHVQYIHTDN